MKRQPSLMLLNSFYISSLLLSTVLISALRTIVYEVSTWLDAVKLLLYGLLCGLQHQVPDVQDLDGCHGVLVHLHLWLRPVHGDSMAPQLNAA